MLLWPSHSDSWTDYTILKPLSVDRLVEGPPPPPQPPTRQCPGVYKCTVHTVYTRTAVNNQTYHHKRSTYNTQGPLQSHSVQWWLVLMIWKKMMMMMMVWSLLAGSVNSINYPVWQYKCWVGPEFNTKAVAAFTDLLTWCLAWLITTSTISALLQQQSNND